jgi:hypothetical protein
MNGRVFPTPRSSAGENLVRLAVSTAILTLAACGGSDQAAESDLNALQNVPEMAAAMPGELNAATDVAEATAGGTVVVPILSNDSIPADSQFRLVGSPANGSATLLPGGEVSYTPNEGFEGTDVIDYLLVDADGNEATGKLYIAVVCAECNMPELAAIDASGLPYCVNESSDPDGDGYGWEDNASCAIPTAAAALSPLAAKADSVEIGEGQIKTITPLRNDSIADRNNVVMSIETAPTAGRIEAIEAGIIVYAAPDNYNGSDSLIYSITNADGDTAVASVDFTITCADCVEYKALRLSWPANPDSEGVEGYKVLFGSDANPLTSVEISDVKVIDGEAPEVVFDLAEDLSLASSEGGCFMIQAYRGAETSEASEAACFNGGS